jgi:hypothetical protein
MQRVLLLTVVVVILGASVVLYRRTTAVSRSVDRSFEPAAARLSESRGSGDQSKTKNASLPSGAAAVVAPPGAAAPAVPQPVDLLALDLGGHVEFATSESDTDKWSAFRVLERNPETGWLSKSPPSFPEELVFSFAGRDAALISAVVFRFGLNPSQYDSAFAKDVEVWTSMDSPTSGFVKQGGSTLSTEAVDQPIRFDPVETRYLKVRVLSKQGATPFVVLGKVKAIEAQRAGYQSIVTRNPELVAFFSPRVSPRASEKGARPTADSVAASDASARSPAIGQPPALQPESRKVLVVTQPTSEGEATHHNVAYHYPPTEYKPTRTGRADGSIFGRLTFSVVRPQDAWPTKLAPTEGIDTVVLAQICDIETVVPEPFKVALMAWVAEGHKLIMQDADGCGASRLPDYRFLPYRFATSNPGKHGSEGDKLIFVEENPIANGNPEDPGFLDIKSWMASTNGSINELGDTNIITAYDPHWCGHLFGTNLLHANGFMEAYTHYGRGLIIYDGFDIDQRLGAAYRQLVTRELAQPFDPDGLPCTAKIGDFVITTEEQLKSQWMIAGKEYRYPLTLLSNQAYKGTIKLTATVSPLDPTVTTHFSVDTVEVTELSHADLTVTTTATAPRTAHKLTVLGADAAGKSNSLDLYLNERRSGGIRVVAAAPPQVAQPKKPTKNLEIILDLSGSMKLPLDRSTRIGTARQVLRAVLAKVPDDFNVGLRFYGHRYGSRQKETCTDTELVLPIEKLDRARLLSLVNRTQPRGETPLVYSVLQTLADLKPLGGGSVVLITDGEESCNGDPAAAARQLKDSGIDVTLNIVGFTLTGKEVERQLGTLAEATGGRYYSAQSGDQLARALIMAAVEKFPYTVFDASGRQVATGEAGQAAADLPAGEYRVVVGAGDEQLTADHLTVTPGRDTVVKVGIKGDRFAIER